MTKKMPEMQFKSGGIKEEDRTINAYIVITAFKIKEE